MYWFMLILMGTIAIAYDIQCGEGNKARNSVIYQQSKQHNQEEQAPHNSDSDSDDEHNYSNALFAKYRSQINPTAVAIPLIILTHTRPEEQLIHPDE